MRIAIIAAVPLELKHLVRDWTPVRQPTRTVKLWRHADSSGDTFLAACAGMGPEAVRRAFAAAEQEGALDVVLSVGLAGATDPGVRLGSVYVLSEIIDARTGERFSLSESDRRLRIASLPVVADASEKLRLHQTYGAAMVDMEAATVARMARQRDIPMHCVKAISDDASAVLPDINPYVRNGQIRLAPFLANVAMRPRHWRPLLHLGRNSAAAARNLAGALTELLTHKHFDRATSTGFFEAQS